MVAPVLITGAAGFIGAALAARYLATGVPVVGVDNLNDYYDPSLKEMRLAQLRQSDKFVFQHLDVSDGAGVTKLFETHGFEIVVHLAAQAGVRYSLENPHAYLHSNIDGFLNILEACRHHPVRHLVFASSSSVYGAVTKMPFSVHQNVDHPVSLYAATKKSNELMAHCYSHLFRVPVTGLRFFTVYGPWGRPDMALMIFANAMLRGQPIAVFNNGQMMRDFTYIDDIVEGVYRVAAQPPVPNVAWDGRAPDPATSLAPYRIYNIGNNAPVALMRVIELLEENLGVSAIRDLRPMQPGDVPATFADIDDFQAAVDFRPATTIDEGIARFAAWYKTYHKA